MTEVTAAFPPKLSPLFDPYRYKVMYGGRGGGKSWSVGRALLIQGMQEKTLILCAREIQKSISDSVHRLLADQVEAMGLSSFYQVLEKTIRGVNGTEFVFAGLRQQSVDNLKSYEGVDICWCEEAHKITKRSWDVLIPTIRKPDSEIWITFNPELDSDETYTRFVANPPPDAWVAKISYQDNPWFPDVLEKERVHAKQQDPEGYENIWEGNPRTVVEGAIYHREVVAMVQSGRIRAVPYDPMLRVHTIWDLGWNDQTSIIFAQRLHSEVRIIDYWEDSFKRLDEWIADLNKKSYRYGVDWMPHDARAKDIKTGKSVQEIAKTLGRRVAVVPNLTVESGINAARMMFPRVYVDESCKRLVECLKRYRRNVPQTTGEPGKPLHDEHSHGADAFRMLAIVVDKLTNDDRKPLRIRHHRTLDNVVGY